MSDKDKFADALHAMSAGEPEQAHDAAAAEVFEDTRAPEAPAPAAAAPVAPKPAVARPKPVPAPEAPVARQSRPAAPASSPRPVAKVAAPVAPATPAAPTRASRPSAPTSSRKPVAAPVPQPVATPAVRVDYAAAQKGKPMAVGTLNFRRTLIPPCLVIGVSSLLLTVLYFLQPADSALGQISKAVPIGLAVLGLIVLAAGVFNMLLVKHELGQTPVTAR